MEPSILSLLPPLITIGLAIVTRRVLVALLVGIVLGALMYSEWNVVTAAEFVYDVASGLVIAEGAVAEEMYILAFVFLLGILTSLVYVSGGLAAFADWVTTRVRTRVQAQLVPVVLGVILFFDDAFSSLVGGNVSRPITDRHRVSRAKLSYLVESTAAPVIILVPISGWAAFIAVTMTGIFEDNQITQYTGYEAFVRTIPANYYAITALVFVFTVALLDLNFGPMRKHEARAVREGELWDSSRGGVPGEADPTLTKRTDGRVIDLFVPVATLIGVTLAIALYIGITGTDGGLTPMKVLTNTDVILALFYGGLLACLVAAAMLLMRRTPGSQVGRATWSGIVSMVTAACVLFLAWVTAEIISSLGIGEYVASYIDGDMAYALLPALLFLLASFISFSIGSTFGTFGLILPIAAEIVVSVDMSLLIPAFGAVLAGAIFGDHTSPLSDTTILSSIGSGVHLVDHVTTQLPYALVCSAASVVGYVVAGATTSTVLGLLAALTALGVAVLVLRAKSPKLEEREPSAVRDARSTSA